MKKSFSLIAIIVILVGCGAIAEAQQAKVYRVGVLAILSPDHPTLKGLRDGLREAGYIEGKNLFLDVPLNKTYEELRPIAKSYGEKKFDAIVTVGGTTTALAKEATQQIPIIFMYGTDPVGSGLVKSLARPGTNVTGLTSYTDIEIQGKRLEVFKEVVPSLRRVAVLYNARGENPNHARSLDVAQKVAPSLGLKLTPKPIKSAAELEQALSALSNNTDGIFMICSTLFRKPFKNIASIAKQKRLPLMGCSGGEVADQGSLLEYDTDRYRLGHRGAWYVDRILKGTKPQDLPVETPTKFELIINLKTAKQIGITIPPNVLARADKVIK